jgi:hypothetical protein
LDCGHGDHIVNFHTLMLLKIRHDRVFLVWIGNNYCLIL